MKKTILLITSFLSMLFAVKAQTKFELATVSTKIDFVKANQLLASNSTYNSTISSSYFVRDKAYYEDKISRYKKMKIAGIVLASVGAGALAGTIAGSIVIVRNNRDDDGYGYGTGINRPGFFKVYGLAVGGALLTGGLIGTGIPLAINGAKKEKRYKAKLKALN